MLDVIAAEAPAVTLDPDYSIKPLVVAVIQQARREAKHDPAARDWLLSDGVIWIDAIMDIHPDKIRAWVAGNFKPLKRKKKRARKPQDERSASKSYRTTPSPAHTEQQRRGDRGTYATKHPR